MANALGAHVLRVNCVHGDHGHEVTEEMMRGWRANAQDLREMNGPYSTMHEVRGSYLT
jgi:hypothetical protein